MNKLIFCLGLSLFLGSLSARADSEAKVLQSMKKYVKTHTENNGFMPVVYRGKVLRLQVASSTKYPDGFHTAVQNQGNLYAACADFTDKDGNKYDVDFLVSKVKGGYQVVQPVVHSVNGEKNPYDLSH